MEWSHYRPDVLETCRGLGLPMQTPADVLRSSGAVTAANYKMLLERGLPRADIESAMAGNSSVSAIECLYLLMGTVVYVEDVQLVEALLRTDISAALSEITFPYPLIEFVFPRGIPLGVADFEVAGTVVCQHQHDVYARVFKKHKVEYTAVRRPNSKLEADTTVLVRLSRLGLAGSDRHGVRYSSIAHDHQFSPEESRQLVDDEVSRKLGVGLLPSVNEADRDELEATDKQVRLAMALLLFLQTDAARAQASLVERERSERRTGVPSAIASELKRRKAYRIPNLSAGRARYYRYEGEVEPTGRMLQTGGWRKGHLRTYKHERYARRADGTCVTQWIWPTWVGPEGTTVRKIKVDHG